MFRQIYFEGSGPFIETTHKLLQEIGGNMNNLINKFLLFLSVVLQKRIKFISKKQSAE